MTDEITLIMPCQACEVGCEWPLGAATTIQGTLSGMTVFSCPACADFNDTYLPPFLEKQEFGPLVTCVYEFFFPSLICTAERFLMFSSRNIITRDLTFGVQMFNDQGGPLWSWQDTFFGPEKETNGPFIIPALTGFFICDIGGLSSWEIVGI